MTQDTYNIVSLILFLSLAVVWRKDTFINAIIKVGLYLMAAAGLIIIINNK